MGTNMVVSAGTARSQKHMLSGETAYGSVEDFLAGTLEWSWPGRLKLMALRVADRS